MKFITGQNRVQLRTVRDRETLLATGGTIDVDTLLAPLPGDSPAGEVDVPACIVRAAPQGDGRYDVGVRFLLEDAGFVEEKNA